MDQEIPNATQGRRRQSFPWLASYPPGVPATIERLPMNCWARSRPIWRRASRPRRAFTTIMPNGMAASLSFAKSIAIQMISRPFCVKRLCLEPGARVAIQIPNGLAYPVAAFGIFKAGCVLVNVNPLYTAHEMVHLFQDAEPAAIVAIDMFADKLADALEAGSDPACRS